MLCPTYVLLRSAGAGLTFQHLSVDLKFKVIQAVARSKPNILFNVTFCHLVLSKVVGLSNIFGLPQVVHGQNAR
jgi:dihydroorotase-like cyclic amidohydrolase